MKLFKIIIGLGNSTNLESANVEHVCRLKIHNGFEHVDQDYMTQETIYFQQIS